MVHLHRPNRLWATQQDLKTHTYTAQTQQIYSNSRQMLQMNTEWRKRMSSRWLREGDSATEFTIMCQTLLLMCEWYFFFNICIYTYDHIEVVKWFHLLLTDFVKFSNYRLNVVVMKRWNWGWTNPSVRVRSISQKKGRVEKVLANKEQCGLSQKLVRERKGFCIHIRMETNCWKERESFW